MPISPARKIAFEVLRRVEAEGAYASDVLHEALGASVKAADAALATELVFGVLRWRRLLDCLLDRHLKKPVERLDLPVALALRMGVYQLRFLRKIPPRAAVNESVELVKMARKTSAASLANAVLRKAASEASEPAEGLLPRGLEHAEWLAILHSHPTWMVERWIRRFGEAGTTALLEANNERPRLSCALHHPDQRQHVFDELERAGLSVERGMLLKNAFAVSGGSPARTEAFRAGLISIQDEASQAVPLLFGVQPGHRVLDLCAAPGGKTAALARAAGRNGRVIAADRHAHRLKAMQAQFDRLKLDGVRLVELDAEQPLPFGVKFDRILVDAPCSGTGTLARHPEIRWRLRPEQLAEFHQLQVRMLRNAVASLAPRGRLVYSTCSIEPEENEDVVAEVLSAEASIRQVSANAAAETLHSQLANGLDEQMLFGTDGYFRTLSAIHHTDGFFAAILEHV
ncbi:MAG TPA: 16S rRNA (cytosine(967)-C(5))-methyltransferase RsmB [Candidatus Acidoferrum sp.]|nr:16S rRNA (cytosine(967)-C(5))-methyltransferase RsmB [Candidatus Acidoferrum sp.]